MLQSDKDGCLRGSLGWIASEGLNLNYYPAWQRVQAWLSDPADEAMERFSEIITNAIPQLSPSTLDRGTFQRGKIRPDRRVSRSRLAGVSLA